MNLKKRLDKIINQLGLSGRQFEKETGLPTGSYSSISDGIGASKLQKILITFPQISLDYLVLGEGEMFKTQKEDKTMSPNESRLWNLVESQQKTIEGQTRTIEGQQRTIETLAKKGGAEDAGGAVSGAALG